MTMKNPAHPGRIVKNACLVPLDLSITKGADLLGVTRNTLSRVVHGHSGISPEMAIRLEKMGWSSARAWLAMQSAYELAQARKKASKIKVTPYKEQKVPANARA